MFRELENKHCTEQTKTIETVKTTEWRNNSVAAICYLKVLRLMVKNTVIRTGMTCNPSQDFQKKSGRGKNHDKRGTEQTEQEMLILIRV